MKNIDTDIQWNYISDMDLINTFGGTNDSFEKGKEVGEKIGEVVWTIVFGVLIIRGLKFC